MFIFTFLELAQIHLVTNENIVVSVLRSHPRGVNFVGVAQGYIHKFYTQKCSNGCVVAVCNAGKILFIVVAVSTFAVMSVLQETKSVIT